MSNLLKETVRFRIPFTENYTLITETKIKSGYFEMNTTTKMRWALRVIEIAENGDTELLLFTIEHFMVDTNNENLNDIMALNQVFSRMYNELHVVFDTYGKAVKILNLEQIKSKWQETKAQLLKIQQQEPALIQLLAINDEIFCSSDKIKIAIENNEFFNHYFGKIYGNKLPISRKEIIQKNVLQTADASWMFNFSYSPEFSIEHLDNIIIKYDGEAAAHEKNWKRKAYGHLPDIDFELLKPILLEKGIYRCNFKSGKLDFAERRLTEISLTNIIEASIKYTMQSDSYSSNTNNVQNQNYNDKPFRVID